jgi:transcription-repair coupling factor (superfamily II helicase)
MNLKTESQNQIIQQKIQGVIEPYRSFFLKNFYEKADKKSLFIILSEQKKADQLYRELLALYHNEDVEKIPLLLFFPEIDATPYDYLSSSLSVTQKRISVLNKLIELSQTPDKDQQSSFILITSINAVQKRIVSPLDLMGETLTLTKNQNITRQKIVNFLNENSYKRVDTVYEASQFAIREDLIDIYPVNHDPVRLNFNGIRIESIRSFDTVSQLTVKRFEPSFTLTLSPIFEMSFSDPSVKRFKENYLKIEHATKNDPVFKSVSLQQACEGIENYLPLFCKKSSSLFDYFDLFDSFHYTIILDDLFQETFSKRCQEVNQIYQKESDILKLKNEAEDILKYRNHDKIQISQILPPSALYLDIQEFEALLKEQTLKEQTVVQLSTFKEVICKEGGDEQQRKINVAPSPTFATYKKTDAMHLFSHVVKELDKHNKIKVITTPSDESRTRIYNLLLDYDVKKVLSVVNFPPKKADKQKIYLLTLPLEHGFINDSYIVLTHKDIWGEEHIALHSKKRPKRNFAELISNLGSFDRDDILVHKDHGICQYLGLETVKLEIIDQEDPQKKLILNHDCIKLMFYNNDKLLLPVEHIDLLTRFGAKGHVQDYKKDQLMDSGQKLDQDDSNEEESHSSTFTIKLDRLGSTAFRLKKAKAKKRIFTHAQSLIDLAAKRNRLKGEVFDIKIKEFDEFCAQFPYTETDDQLVAIEETLHDLSSGKLMDRLICGDVGFGKTEVAIRAVFVAVTSKKQVAIMTPTTLLCRQHYQNFLQRFEGVKINGQPIKIAQISRFVSKKETTELKNSIKKGEVDIIVATHSLVKGNFEFKDLGLLIIDEEQAFGVKQKEKLKSMKANVHVLTLSATPIPRTLQLSMSGVMDLSLITTPPLDRLNVRTFVQPFDLRTVKEAILREVTRGGQVFYVTPRLKRLEKIKEQLTELFQSPDMLSLNLRFAIAHGGMTPNALENIMTSFVCGEFNVLLSTQIIESGIDIKTANTLIVDRPDYFGLSQLHQLRGRVGRSSTEGFAYFLLSSHLGEKGDGFSLNSVHEKTRQRLSLLQSLDSLGAGFMLSNYDLDLRGAGNIVGEEQSGHMKDIGVELYQHLLAEAIERLKTSGDTENASDLFNSDEFSEETLAPQINLGVSLLISDAYVSDVNVRVNIYRRIARVRDREEIKAIIEELTDRFGAVPKEVINLLHVIEIKQLCKKLNIYQVVIGTKGLTLSFHGLKKDFETRLVSFLKNKALLKLGIPKFREDKKVVLFRDFSNNCTQNVGESDNSSLKIAVTKTFITTLVQNLKRL